MIRFLKFHIAVLLGVIALCSGCSAPEPPPPTPPENDVPWVYEPDAVVLRISADERLNEHEGEPSSLMLCVYRSVAGKATSYSPGPFPIFPISRK